MSSAGDRKNRKVIWAILITVVVILALVGGYFLYKNYDNKRLNEVFSLGYNKSLQDVAQGQTQTLSILTWDNNSIQIRSMQDICKQLAGQPVTQ
jgi:hypothetical protein